MRSLGSEDGAGWQVKMASMCMTSIRLAIPASRSMGAHLMKQYPTPTRALGVAGTNTAVGSSISRGMSIVVSRSNLTFQSTRLPGAVRGMASMGTMRTHVRGMSLMQAGALGGHHRGGLAHGGGARSMSTGGLNSVVEAAAEVALADPVPMGWWPSQLMEAVFVSVHDGTGLTWGLTIIAVTSTIRVLLIPVIIFQVRVICCGGRAACSLREW